MSYLCDEFDELLQAHIKLEEFFYADTEEIAFPRTSYFSAQARFFTYGGANDLQKACDILRNFTLSRIADQPGILVSLRDWRGDYSLSWKLPGGK